MLVGNDVVDVGDPEAAPWSLHPRFDARVFRQAELEGIARLGAGTAAGTRERWSLWAAKEASYKAARKLDRETIFSPIRFEVAWLTPTTALGEQEPHGASVVGVVRHGGTTFDVEVRHGEGFVHAIATHPHPHPCPRPHPDVISGVRELGSLKPHSSDASRPSRAARALACDEIAARLGLGCEALEIGREDRIPRLYAAGQRAPGDLSLSHHGRFVAFAYWLERALVGRAGGILAIEVGGCSSTSGTRRVAGMAR